MAQPFDYTINASNPARNLLNSVAAGQGLLQLKNAQQQMKQAEVNFQSQQQMQEDLARLSQNPNPAAVAQMMVKYPALSEHFKRTYDVLGSETQKARLDQASQVYAALNSGDSELAQEILADQASAYENSGMAKEAKTLRDLSELINLNPETAKTSTALFLASTMGPEKFTETFTKMEADRRERDLEPSTLTRAQAEARAAAAKANFAESEAALDLQKKGWDIAKIQEDIKIAKENNRIAAMRADIEREDNELKRQELQQKLKDAEEKRNQEVRNKVAMVEQARTTIDNSLSTIDRVLQNPSLNDVVGSLEGGWFGAVKNILDDESQNAIADIDTIRSQTFLNKLMELKSASEKGSSGLGSLTEKEGEHLINSLQSLSRKQGEKQFTSNLMEVQRLLLKARKSMAEKHGMPDTIPDTPNVQTDPADIDALVKKYTGG